MSPDQKALNIKVLGGTFVLVVLIAVFFLKWLPEIGHQILMRDYYGFANTEIFQDVNEDFKCGERQELSTEGVFLGMYPYRATLSKDCIRDFDTGKDNLVSTRIRVRKPYNFLEARMLNREELIVSAYKIVFHKAYIEKDR